jgi:hypothetical protein
MPKGILFFLEVLWVVGGLSPPTTHTPLLAAVHQKKITIWFNFMARKLQREIHGVIRLTH